VPTTTPRKITCRTGCAFRTVPSITLEFAPTDPLAWDSRLGCPPLGAKRALDCGPLATALLTGDLPPNDHAPSGQPLQTRLPSVVAGQRSVLTGEFLTFCVEPVESQLIISNRSARRLETPVTPTSPTNLPVLIDTNSDTKYTTSPRPAPQISRQDFAPNLTAKSAPNASRRTRLSENEMANAGIAR
jgi:hypothetical protein